MYEAIEGFLSVGADDAIVWRYMNISKLESLWPNVGYAIELYERYLADPSSVDDETRAIFERLGRDEEAAIASLTRPASATPVNGNGASAGRTSSTSDGLKSIKGASPPDFRLPF